MFTEKEIERIFSWMPYRENWPVNRNERDDNVQAHFGKLISAFLYNTIFNCIQSQDGGTSNYLEFMCYRKGERSYEGKGILVRVNLCAPIAAYGMTNVNVAERACGSNGINPEEVGVIHDPELKGMESHIIGILSENDIETIDHVFASKTLPPDVHEALEMPLSDKYLDGLFQMSS